MKKIIYYIVFTFLTFTLYATNTLAYSYEITSRTIVVGDTVNLVVDASDNIGKFDIVSSNTGVVTVEDGSRWLEKERGVFKITAKKAGTANITITPSDVSTTSGSEVTGAQTIAITVVARPTTTKPTTPKAKSSNNNLSSLTIDGYSLDKDFDKDTLEYFVTVPSGTDKININAQLEDSSAKVSGTGEVTLNTGENKFSIEVTAENGTKKTYTLTVIVNEMIKVKINNEEYSIIEQEGVLEPLENYTKTTIKIDDKEVLAYYNEKTKYTLVILADKDNNSNYYIYENGKYKLYKEYDFNGTRLYLLDLKKNNNFISSELSIGSDKVKAYQLYKNKKNSTYALDSDSISNYYLIYAMNVENGNKGYYLIDNKENGAIRFTSELESYFLDVNTSDNYKLYFFIAIGILGLTVLGFGITLIVKGKKKNKINFK